MGPECQAEASQCREAMGETSPVADMEVYTDFQGCGDLAWPWDEFVERVSGDIFLTWDWQRVWWKYYGEGRSLRIYVFRRGPEWTGLLPMFVETVSLGPVSIRRAKAVGSDFSLGQFRPAIEAASLGAVLRGVLWDLERLGCDQVILGPIAGRYPMYSKLKACLQEAGGERFSVHSREDLVQTYYHLGVSYEQWLEGFKSAQRNNIRRDYRCLEKQSIAYVFEQADAGTWEEMFEDFVRLHQEDWNRKGKLGHFGDWPAAEAFHRELIAAQLPKGRVRLLRVRCSDGSRACSYNYRFGGQYFEYLLGRTLTSPQGVSLGRLLHSETVRRAAGESVEWIDAMRGKYDYKSHLGGTEMPLRLIFLNRKGIRSGIRVPLFSWAAKAYNFLYRGLYYRYAAVRLPRRWRRGLRASWIRACGL